jgi:pyrroline-5-carboxylate reductase
VATVGLIGSGNMARALARGWGDPVLCTDGGSGRAAALARELGGEALASNEQLAERADLVILCHKPAQLEDVAAELAPHATVVVSVLGGVTLDALRAAYPDAQVFRAMPNTPVEVGRGIVALAAPADADPDVLAEVIALFERVAMVAVLPEGRIDAATAVIGVTPAYISLVTEALVDGGIKRGLPAETASVLATEALAGTAALLAARGHDTLTVRREVTSPGGMTARGLAVLERAGVRAAFIDAADAFGEGR